MQHLVYLSLGSNQGNRHKYLNRAIELINHRLGQVEAISQFIETEPEGFVSPFMFLNAALRMRTELSPLALLIGLQQIERELGRTQKSHDGIHYDRSIDLDILLYDNVRIDTPILTIPHPRMQERSFVLLPLQEVLTD